MTNFGLPEPDERGDNWRHREIPINQHEMNVEQHRQVANNMEQTLNIEQRVFF